MKLIPNLTDIDSKAVQQAGIPAEMLMENAGLQVALAVQAHCKPLQRGVILCGPGNNGGDGFVCARKLYQAGFHALTVIYTGKQYKQEALANFEQILIGMPIQVINAHEQSELAIQQIDSADFVVDALFGSGLSRPVTGIEAQLIGAVNHAREQNRHAPWVLAVDLPSGVDGATGQILGCAVQAHETVTFACGKPGLYLYPGKTLAGQVSVVDIGIPPRFVEEDESPFRLVTREEARQWLPKRKPDSHKYSHGHVLVVAGSRSMPGAAVLCAEAAMSAGAGLVTLAAPASVFEQMNLMPEITRLPLADENALGAASVAALQQALVEKRYNTVILGPGLGQTPETTAALLALLETLKQSERAVIVDADGLNALSTHPAALNERFILTPHIGECARLLNTDNQQVLGNVLEAAQQARSTYQAHIVLKSASTVIATFGTEPLCWISPTGNPGMATAGSGDVLSGIIGAMAAQRHAQQQNLWQSAPLGVYLHGLAGDAAADALTQYGMKASDITRHLPQAFKMVL